MTNRQKLTTAVVIGAAILFIIAASMWIRNSGNAGSTAGAAAPLTEYWTEGSAPAQELRDYVTKVTKTYRRSR